MERLFTTLISSVALAILGVPMALAQTPDGETPANEGVCDVLQADGTTRGLYGLCVAFCEAQDWSDADIPITAEQLESLEARSPSGRILDAYNKKKSETDPPMPCIVVEEPCPCWTQSELESIDGAGTDGSFFFCPRAVDSIGFVWAQNILEGDPPISAVANNGSAATPPNPFDNCQFFDFQAQPPVVRSFDIAPDEAASCLTAVKARCDVFGL